MPAQGPAVGSRTLRSSSASHLDRRAKTSSLHLFISSAKNYWDLRAPSRPDSSWAFGTHRSHQSSPPLPSSAGFRMRTFGGGAKVASLVRPGAAGLLIGIKCFRVRNNAWMYLTSFVTTRIGVELVVVQGNYPARL